MVRSSVCSLEFFQIRQTAGMNPFRFGFVLCVCGASLTSCVSPGPNSPPREIPGAIERATDWPPAPPAIIPMPASLQLTEGKPFVLTTETNIHADTAAAPVANWLARWSGLKVSVSGAGDIALTIEP